MNKAKSVIKSGVECPNCGYLNAKRTEHYAQCDNCKTEYESPESGSKLDMLIEKLGFIANVAYSGGGCNDGAIETARTVLKELKDITE